VKSIDKPIVKEFVSVVPKSESIQVKGETIKNANLSAKVTSKNKTFIATDEFQSGSGEFTWSPKNHLKSGTYFISFKVTDARGASSSYTDPIEIKVGTGIHIDLMALIDSIPPEVAMIGLAILGIVLVI
ncbi:hypothetical protein, partial [Staphylococcus aureus]|uniref:hypothetical protein n=1 Tax=Staphylococcus aureus TaxID=1280 RepID=UPI0039BE901C